MELLIITAVQSFEKDVKKLLKENGVKVYSHMDVTGFKDLSDEAQNANWFASDSGEHRSALFYAFVEEAFVDKVLKAIEVLNSTQETSSYVHAAVLNIKKSV
ncbi:hypothetical protein [Ekhidna sp.]|uniref:hypothetical protein n=1 Tax=Ekhidna sp. TaxID=2608089 RepID=UPI003B5BB77D